MPGYVIKLVEGFDPKPIVDRLISLGYVPGSATPAHRVAELCRGGWISLGLYGDKFRLGWSTSVGKPYFPLPYRYRDCELVSVVDVFDPKWRSKLE